jgi:hypothetical protein
MMLSLLQDLQLINYNYRHNDCHLTRDYQKHFCRSDLLLENFDKEFQSLLLRSHPEAGKILDLEMAH